MNFQFSASSNDCDNQFYHDILENHIRPNIKDKTINLRSLLDELMNNDLRSIMIIGAAYIEELCKECFLNTILHKHMKKEIKSSLNFHLTVKLLRGQDYISEDVYNLIDIIRKVRNEFAHQAIINDYHGDVVESNASKIQDIMQGKSILNVKPYCVKEDEILKNIIFDFEIDEKSELKKRINSVTSHYLTAISDLIFGLSAMSMWIIPEQRLVDLAFFPVDKRLQVFIDINQINELTVSHFERKYTSE